MRISDWSSDVCSSDLVSAPPPNALSSRMAISGEIPAWPFTRSESCLRLTPSCLAASVTLSPKGSRQSCLTDRPGCGGFFMGIALSAPLLAQEFETLLAKALYPLRSVTYHLSTRPTKRPAVLHGLPRFADVERSE